MRSYECHVPGLDWSLVVINAETAGKARYQVYQSLKESWGVPITAIRVRSVGAPLPALPSRTEIAQREADEFNAAHPIGTSVRYWRGLKQGEPSGQGEIYHAATVVCENAVAWIKGCSGCISLTHVEAVSV